MKQKPQGFTLVEVLVAMLILAVMMVGFFYVSSANAGLFKRNDDRSKIVTYAQDVLERVKISWSDVSKFEARTAVVVPVPPSTGYTVDPLTVEYLTPTGNVVNSGPYFTSPVLYRVTLNIKYKDPQTSVISNYYTVAVRIGHPAPPKF